MTATSWRWSSANRRPKTPRSCERALQRLGLGRAIPRATDDESHRRRQLQRGRAQDPQQLSRAPAKTLEGDHHLRSRAQPAVVRNAAQRTILEFPVPRPSASGHAQARCPSEPILPTCRSSVSCRDCTRSYNEERFGGTLRDHSDSRVPAHEEQARALHVRAAEAMRARDRDQPAPHPPRRVGRGDPHSAARDGAPVAGRAAVLPSIMAPAFGPRRGRLGSLRSPAVPWPSLPLEARQLKARRRSGRSPQISR